VVERKITKVFGQVLLQKANEVHKGRPSFGIKLPA